MDDTPSVALPADASPGIPRQPPAPTLIGERRFTWGERTYVMGILNVTPDSFSGDGLLARADDAVEAALAEGQRMVAAGADILDVGGESSRPGHEPVSEDEELRRVVPVVRALSEALPDVPLSVDTTKHRVAVAAFDAGADMINDVWGVGADDALARLAAERGAPLVVMHNRSQARYASVLAEVIADLARAVERALALSVDFDNLIVDPGIGFGKTAEQNLLLLRQLSALRCLGRPILLGTSRKSTIGKVLDLPAGERLEGTLATTVLGVANGADIVRVHDVAANVRAARMSDAVVRGAWREEGSR
ncbi:MAG: dihydropteroate synthase [Chloroflexota bacterium]|nr:dihydropteroate synthase [Chloroflexota bacterium]